MPSSRCREICPCTEVYDWKHPRARPRLARPNRIRIPLDLASLGSQEPSAAQNGTVIQTCRQCGAAHGAESSNCYVCRARLSPDDGSELYLQPGEKNGSGLYLQPGEKNGSGLCLQPGDEDRGQRVGSNGAVRTDGALAFAPDWRSEVTLRLQEYRKRQRRLRDGPSQPELAFGEETGSETGKAAPSRPVYAATAQSPAVPLMHRRMHRIERVEIDLLQPSLDFSSAGSPPDAARGAAHWHVALVLPMASLHERRLAALLDAGLILLAYGGFLSLFAALGGRLAASKLDAAVLVATLALFYGQYFALFTLFGGATPGMIWRGLRPATFDGGEPHLSHLAWRSFGYLVSAGTLTLGFLWALWDEDHLCWHDRISHTHLTWTPKGTTEADGIEPDGTLAEASQPASREFGVPSDGVAVGRSTPGCRTPGR